MFKIDRNRVRLTAPEIVRIYADRDAVETQPPEETEKEPIDVPHVAQAEERANEILDTARVRAEKTESDAKDILNRAGLDAEKIRIEAEERGYKEGEKRAEERCERLLAENREALGRVVAEIEAGRARMLENMESEIIDLCFAIVRKVADLNRTKDGELFKAAITKALSRTNSESSITIHLCNEDFERFFPDGEAAFETADGRVTAVIAGNTELAGGDIIIDTERETINAGIDSQIRNIELRFRQQLGNADEFD